LQEMEEVEALLTRVIDVKGGGASPDGALAVAELVLENGYQVNIACETAIAAKLIYALQVSSQAAQEIRQRIRETDEEADVWGSRAYEASQLQFFLSRDGQKVVLQASGPSGPPVNISFDASDLRGLQTSCKRTAEQARRLRARSGH
jgi:hypothetical protein